MFGCNPTAGGLFQAVLGYLREKEDGGTHSSDSNSSIPDSGMAYIPLKPIAESAIISKSVKVN